MTIRQEFEEHVAWTDRVIDGGASDDEFVRWRAADKALLRRIADLPAGPENQALKALALMEIFRFCTDVCDGALRAPRVQLQILEIAHAA